MQKETRMNLNGIAILTTAFILSIHFVCISTKNSHLSFNTVQRIENGKYNSSDKGRRNLASVPDTILWNNDYRNDGNFWITIRFGTGFSKESKKTIIDSLRNLETRSKVIKFTFVDYRPNNAKYLHLHNRDGCWSRLGRTDQSGTIFGQPMGLDVNRCMNTASIQHEMMHALGFGHEQSRLDRDQYIKVEWNNIVPEKKRMFEKISEVNSLGTPYDFESIMHYSPYDWSKNGKATMIPLDPSKTIGSRTSASPIDILQIQLMYQCQNGPRNLQEFQNAPCTSNCQCWENKTGCQNQDSFCKGDLVCVSNKCQDPYRIPILNKDKTKKQLVKDRIQGSRYFMVPGVMFDIQAKASTIFVTNLIFKGLGLPNQPEKVEVDIFTKKWTHLGKSNKPSTWTYIGNVTLQDDGSDSAQLFPRGSFSPIRVNPWNRQAFYIQVKNCPLTCHKLRVWTGNNYSVNDSPYLEDGNSRMLEGCVLPARFNNDYWRTCKDSRGGTSYTFWGGFEYAFSL